MTDRLNSWQRLPWLISALLLAGLLLADGLGAWLSGGTSLLGQWDARSMDGVLRLQAQARAPSPDIVLVKIDRKSLENISGVLGEGDGSQKIGGWPWPRSVHAELIADLEDHGAKAVVFDIFFSDPDNFRPDSDQMLSDTAAAYPNLYFASLLLGDGVGAPFTAVPPSMGFSHGTGADMQAHVPLQVPLILKPESWQGGLVNFETDPDGIGRHARLYRQKSGWTLPYLPATLAHNMGWKVPEGEAIRLHWYGKPFQSVSYSDLLGAYGSQHPKVPAPDLRNKIVIIGATAPGLGDFRPTTMSKSQEGMEVIATAISNLQHGDWLRDLPVRPVLLLILLPALGFAFSRRLQPWRIGLLLALANVLIGGASYALLSLANLAAPVAVALGSAWLLFAVLTLVAQLLERREREATVAIFNRFLDPRVVGDLVKSGEISLSQKAQSRDISILFSDIRGFTTLSETRSPEVVVAILNRYFDLQVAVIFKHGGTLDKFIGDAIMAFWNAPTQDAQHATHAVRAAVEMAEVLDDFKRELTAQDPALEDFDIGIGIHTGPAVVGFIGAESRLDYTVIGDTVNLASRIEGCTKGVCRVLVSDSTRAACAGQIPFRDHGEFHVKGRSQGVGLFEPLAQK